MLRQIKYPRVNHFKIKISKHCWQKNFNFKRISSKKRKKIVKQLSTNDIFGKTPKKYLFTPQAPPWYPCLFSNLPLSHCSLRCRLHSRYSHILRIIINYRGKPQQSEKSIVKQYCFCVGEWMRPACLLSFYPKKSSSK